MHRRHHRELPLAHYAVIGDGLTAALVAKDGAIDWLCYPRFDSPAVFCRLLDPRRGGYLQVAPTTPFSATRRYLGSTNVLATELETAGGKLRLVDFMPLEGAASGTSTPVILRKLEGLSGSVEVAIDFVPTFDFARERVELATVELAMAARGCEARSSGGTLRLSSPARVLTTARGATSSFPLRAGEAQWIALTDGAEPPSDEEAERSLSSTLERWERWAARTPRPAPQRAAPETADSPPDGGMVAAPTTSLPESPAGVRNCKRSVIWRSSARRPRSPRRRGRASAPARVPKQARRRRTTRGSKTETRLRHGRRLGHDLRHEREMLAARGLDGEACSPPDHRADARLPESASLRRSRAHPRRGHAPRLRVSVQIDEQQHGPHQQM